MKSKKEIQAKYRHTRKGKSKIKKYNSRRDVQDKKNIFFKQWRLKNLDKVKKNYKTWAEKNPEKRRESKIRYLQKLKKRKLLELRIARLEYYLNLNYQYGHKKNAS